MKAETIFCYCISKLTTKKHPRITIHGYVSGARLTGCEVGVFLREISQLLKNTPIPLFEELLVHPPWAYFREIMVYHVRAKSNSELSNHAHVCHCKNKMVVLVKYWITIHNCVTILPKRMQWL